MTRPLSLGDQREPALEHAAALVAQAWRDFDTARDEETIASPELLTRLREPLPEEPGDVHADLDLAADVLDASLAQSRPRYLAYIGSSGLEVGALADLLAHSYDINLALDARAATQLEHQAIAWLAAFLGFPATGGSFTSGGTISNMTALAAARERALPGSRSTGMFGRRAALYCSAEAHYSVTRAAELLGIGRDSVRDIAIDVWRRLDPADLAARIDADIADGITASRTRAASTVAALRKRHSLNRRARAVCHVARVANRLSADGTRCDRAGPQSPGSCARRRWRSGSW